jgi:hypothetical protein
MILLQIADERWPRFVSIVMQHWMRSYVCPAFERGKTFLRSVAIQADND